MGSSPRTSPQQLANMQRGENVWTSQYNTIAGNANQQTPYGNITNTPGQQIPIYDQNGRVTGYGTQWNQTTTLSPDQQAILDSMERAQIQWGGLAEQQLAQAKDVLGKPFNTEGLPDWQLYGQGPDLRYEKGPTDRAAIEQAMLQSHRRGVTPQREAEDAQLVARGQMPGGGMDYAVRQGRGDVDAEAARQAYLASGAESREASTAANQALQQQWLNANTRADQQNATRQGMFGERQATRNQIVSEILAGMGVASPTVPQGQAFQGAQFNPFDIAGAQVREDEARAADKRAMWNGLFGIAGAGLKAFA